MYAAMQASSSRCLLLFVLTSIAQCSLSGPSSPDSHLAKRRGIADYQVNYQVHEPVLTPDDSTEEHGCVHTQTLMDHTFGWAYGVPFIGNYTPPPCSFNRVTMNLTVSSKGRQFDRLGIMYLGGVEVFRTSTAEPTSTGIVWTYLKEMTQYNALWTKKQQLEFFLPNVVDDHYTGEFAMNLTATFFTVPDSAKPADEILPIISDQVDFYGRVFRIPDSGPAIKSLQLPRNIEKAVISLSACGQSNEEFWYSNAFSRDTQVFGKDSQPGFSPFREVQLLIDGQLAGVSWPFPVIFTGGISHLFWRPIAAPDAFDLRQHEIDVTPWLPLLCDGASHKFELRVAGLNDNGTLSESVGSFWLVTGTVFIFLDKSGSITKGSMPSISSPAPQISAPSSTIIRDSQGDATDLKCTANVTREYSAVSQITTSSGTRQVSWSQHMSYSSYSHVGEGGRTSWTAMELGGLDKSPTYSRKYSFPLTVKNSYSVVNGKLGSLNGTVTQGLSLETIGHSVFPSDLDSYPVDPSRSANTISNSRGNQTTPSNPFIGSKLSTNLTTNAVYVVNGELLGNGNRSSRYPYGYMSTEQDFNFAGINSVAPVSSLPLSLPSTSYTLPSSSRLQSLYSRHVESQDGYLVVDDEEIFNGTALARVPHRAARFLGGLEVGPQGGVVLTDTADLVGLDNLRSVLGRGPGGNLTGIVKGGKTPSKGGPMR